MKFKIGDTVVLTHPEVGIMDNHPTNPHYDERNPCIGKVVKFSSTPVYPIFIRWDNGFYNKYEEKNLSLFDSNLANRLKQVGKMKQIPKAEMKIMTAEMLEKIKELKKNQFRVCWVYFTHKKHVYTRCMFLHDKSPKYYSAITIKHPKDCNNLKYARYASFQRTYSTYQKENKK